MYIRVVPSVRIRGRSVINGRAFTHLGDGILVLTAISLMNLRYHLTTHSPNIICLTPI